MRLNNAVEPHKWDIIKGAALHTELAFRRESHKLFAHMTKCNGARRQTVIKAAACLLMAAGLFVGAYMLFSCGGACAGEDVAPMPVPPTVTEPAPGAERTEEVRPAKKRDPLAGDFDWDAVQQSFVEDKGALVLSGSAWVRFKGTKLEADHIVLFRQPKKEVYAEGNIRLRMGESEVAAERAYLDFGNDTGYLTGAVVRVSAPPNVLEGVGGGAAKKEAEKEAEREEIRQLDLTNVIRKRDPYGVYIDPINDPQARSNLVVSAKTVVYHDRKHLSAEDAFITSDDMTHPMYGVKVGQMDLFMKDVPQPGRPDRMDLKPQRIVAKRARLTVLGFSFFPFPTITYDLIKQNMFYQVHGGSSKRWGPYVLTRIGYGLGGSENKYFDPTHVYLDLDERYKRGPAIGGELQWQTGKRPPEADKDKSVFERGHGHFRVYVMDEVQTSRTDDIIRARRDLERRIQPKIDGFPQRQFDANLLFIKRRRLEDAGPPSFEIDEHRDEFRGLVDFQHHQPLKRFGGIDNLQMDLKYQRQTDRDFMVEYFQNNYLTQNQSEALASIRKPGDNYSVELLYRANPQDFDGAPPRSPVDYGTYTGYEPALTYSLTPTPLYSGFYLTGEAQVARMTRDFERSIYDVDGFEADRIYTRVDVSRPFKMGAINLVPHIGTQQQAYDNSRTGGSTTQGALTYGIDATTRFYGTFADFENEALGLKGLRHIVEPRVSYGAVGDTRKDPEDLLDFDEIEDLTRTDKITFAIDQTAQTRRPSKDGSGERTYNVAGFDMALDYLPRGSDQDRLLGGNSFDLFRMDGFVRVLDVLKLDASMGYNLEERDLEKAAYSLTIDPGTRWRLKFEERFHFHNNNRAIEGSDQFRMKFDYQLSERWGFSVEQIHERRKSLLTRKGRQLQRFTLTRNYGALAASITYAIDKNLRDNQVFFSVRPQVAYRNLIVPSQDLLVAEGEVSGDSETPEEHNFDPFELLKKHNKKKAPARDKNNVPPPAVAPGTDDAPVPPPPAPDKRAKNNERNSTADQDMFRDPRKRSTPQPKVDDDEWTSPPSTPTSR
jgi:lipopolysaccharide assembly outer membrane protein LptD (OstA)